jgi:hypothetical protein
VAILPTMTAAELVSAGRLTPLGPLGIGFGPVQDFKNDDAYRAQNSGNQKGDKFPKTGEGAYPSLGRGFGQCASPNDRKPEDPRPCGRAFLIWRWFFHHRILRARESLGNAGFYGISN